MTPDRQRLRDEILEAALGLKGNERSALLDRMCGDDRELRRQIEALLQETAEVPADFLGAPAVGLLVPKLQPGQRVGRYVIREILGTGGMSVVYRASDPTIDREVAVKILVQGSEDDEWRRRFQEEVRLQGKLQHENVVRVYDFGEFAGLSFIVMELLHGKTLSKAIQDGDCGDLPRKLELARQLGRALEYVHSQGIVHRDVKPGNVFLESSGRVKLMDFGISRSNGPRLTRQNALLGTLDYMSPEQFESRPATPASDVYSFGVLLYEMITGRLPFGGGMAELVKKVLHDPVPSAPLEAAGAGPELAACLRTLTAKDPKARPQSFTDALALLDAATGTAPPVPARSRLVAIAAVIAAGFALALLLRKPAETPADRQVAAPSIKLEPAAPAIATPRVSGPQQPAAAGLAALPPKPAAGLPDPAPRMPLPPETAAVNPNSKPAGSPTVEPPSVLPSTPVNPPPGAPPSPMIAARPPEVPQAAPLEEATWSKLAEGGCRTAEFLEFARAFAGSGRAREALDRAARCDYDTAIRSPNQSDALQAFAEKHKDHPLSAAALRMVRAAHARRAVETLLSGYEAAYASRDIAGLSRLRQLSPQTQRTIAQSFKEYEVQRLSLTPISIVVDESTDASAARVLTEMRIQHQRTSRDKLVALPSVRLNLRCELRDGQWRIVQWQHE